MNRLWSGMLLLGIAYGAFCGKLPEVTDGALRASKEAVVLAISLLGVTGLWSGLMEIARKAGMIDSLVKKMGPVMRFLFPKVPSDHPAIQSAATNMICNVFGLGAAATPPGRACSLWDGCRHPRWLWCVNATGKTAASRPKPSGSSISQRTVATAKS